MNPELSTRWQTVFFLLLLSLTTLVPGCVGPRRVSDKNIKSLSMTELIDLVGEQERKPGKRKLLLIDSRARSSFEAGHLPGAMSLLLSEVDPNMDRDEWIDSFDEIVVYADNPGSASGKALVKRMLRMRYDDVRLFPGGFDQWARAGLSTETGE